MERVVFMKIPSKHLFRVKSVTLSLRRPLSYRNQSIDWLASQGTGFYIITASVMNGLIKQ